MVTKSLLGSVYTSDFLRVFKSRKRIRIRNRSFKVDLQCGDYRTKLVPFEAQKNIFNIKKGPSLERFTP